MQYPQQRYAPYDIQISNFTKTSYSKKKREEKLAVVNIMIEYGKAQLIKPSYRAGTVLQVCSSINNNAKKQNKLSSIEL